MCKKYEIKKRANTFHSTVYVNQHQSHQLMKQVNVRSAADQFRLKEVNAVCPPGNKRARLA